MRRVIMLLLFCIVIIGFTMSVSAAYVTDTNFDSGIVTVRGTIAEAASNKLVLIQVANPESNNINTSVVSTDNMGYFEYSFKIDSSSLTNDNYYYTLNVSAYDMSKEYTETFYFAPLSVLTPAIDLIAAATTALQVEVAIEDNSDVLVFITEELFALPQSSRNEVYIGLANINSFSDTDDFQSKFYSLYVPQKIKNSSSSKEVENNLNQYNAHIKLEETAVYDEFSTLSTTDKESVYTFILSNVGNDMSSLKKAFSQGSFLKLISLTENPMQAERLLRDYNADVGINLTKVNNMTELGKAYVEIVGKEYFTIGAMQNALDAVADNENIGSDEQNRLPKGGGGGRISVPISQITEVLPHPVAESSISAIGFSDLSSVSWAAEAIKHLNSKGIVQGYGDNQFNPLGALFREELVTIIVRAFDIFDDHAYSDFVDVNENDWFYQYVSSAYFRDIVMGISDNEFGTGRHITRQDLAVILFRISEYMDLTLLEKRGYSFFTDDNDISDYAKEAVERLYVSGIINGDDTGRFNPLSTCTRAEGSVMLYNMLTRGVESE